MAADTIPNTAFRTTDVVRSTAGFDGLSAITAETVGDIAPVGCLELKAPAIRFAQYPSELRATVEGVTQGMLTIDGESDDTYWWSKKNAVVDHAFLLDESVPRFLFPSTQPRSGGDISRDVAYAACAQVWKKDGVLNRRIDVVDVVAGHRVSFGERVVACAAGTRAMVVAVAPEHLPTTHKRLVFLGPEGQRTESGPMPHGCARLAMSWCDELVFDAVDDRTIAVRCVPSFEVIGELHLEAPAAAMLFFGGVLWVAEKDSPRVRAYGIPGGRLQTYVRPPAKPLARRKAPWTVHPKHPAMTVMDIGPRTVGYAYVDYAPQLIELPDTPLDALRKKAGDDPGKLRSARAKVRKRRKLDEKETPNARRRSFAKAEVSRTLRRALRGGPDSLDAAALDAELRRHGRAYDGIAWRTEDGANVIVQKGKLIGLDGAPASPEGTLRITHRVELTDRELAELEALGLSLEQRRSRVFRASSLKSHQNRQGTLYLLDTGGFGRTDDSWAAKQLVVRGAFVPNTFVDEPVPCFDFFTDGVTARWHMDLEHGAGWLTFHRGEDETRIDPADVPLRAFSIAVDVLTEVYEADHSDTGIQPQ